MKLRNFELGFMKPSCNMQGAGKGLLIAGKVNTDKELAKVTKVPKVPLHKPIQ